MLLSARRFRIKTLLEKARGVANEKQCPETRADKSRWKLTTFAQRLVVKQPDTHCAYLPVYFSTRTRESFQSARLRQVSPFPWKFPARNRGTSHKGQKLVCFLREKKKKKRRNVFLPRELPGIVPFLLRAVLTSPRLKNCVRRGSSFDERAGERHFKIISGRVTH